MLLVVGLFVLLIGLGWWVGCLYGLLWVYLFMVYTLGLILFGLLYGGLLSLVICWLLMR